MDGSREDGVPGALAGVRVLDLTRVLAGPSCTQILGDLGADVIKVERPGVGDDTRRWGPPYLSDRDGQPTGESAYYMSANRNKRSVAIDIARPRGADLIRRLLGGCDVLVENFKVGDLARHGLGWEQLRLSHPRLVYCSITGFGQTGPYAQRPGYDYVAQGMGGIMSLTGEPQGEPMKVGMAASDLVTGLYAAVGILAALRHRDASGQGQAIDLALLDCTLAFMTYEAQNWLLSGIVPTRRGNAHPNIVPYQVFAAADGHLILAIGNDQQFARFCGVAGLPELAADPRYASNTARVANRAILVPLLADRLAQHPRAYWLAGLQAAGVPAGPVQTLPEALVDPHVQARGLVQRADHRDAEAVPLLGSPIRMSATPPAIRRSPPTLGEHTQAVLDEFGIGAEDCAALRAAGVIP